MRVGIYISMIIGLLSIYQNAASKTPAENDSIIIDYQTSAIKIQQQADGSLFCEGEHLQYPCFEVGIPNIPYESVKVLLPPSAEIGSVRVEVLNSTRNIAGQVGFIKPVSPVATKIDGQVYELSSDKKLIDGKDPEIYDRDEPFPTDITGIASVGSMRGWKIVDIPVARIQYNPAINTIYQIDEVKLKLSFSTDKSPKNLNQAPSSKGFVDRIKNGVVNFSAIEHLYDHTKVYDPKNPGDEIGFAIITTNSIVSQSAMLDDYINHKTNLGFTVHLVDENQWNTQGATGDNAAELIRSWLINNYVDERIEYVLLIGNPSGSTGDVPMKRLKPLKDYSALYHSDMYYSDLTGNWNPDSDAYYGEYPDDFTEGGVDRFFDVVVGRIPFYGKIDDLDHILGKIIAYENDPNPQWRKNILLPMKRYHDNARTYYLGEAIKNDFLVPNGFDFHRIWTYDASDPDCPNPETTPINYTNVNNQWNSEPFGAVLWTAHGNAVKASYVTDTSYVKNLDDDHPVFTFQASCSNSHPGNSDNLSYSLLVNGAVATVGCPTTSWFEYYQKYFAGSSSNQGMTYEYARRIIADGLPAGLALADLRQELIIGNWANMCGYNLYGDPTVALMPYNFNTTPDIECYQNSTNLYDIDTLDLTLFDDEVEITIANEGAGRLYLTGDSLIGASGPDPDRFQIAEMPPSVVSSEAEASFTITYQPDSVNIHTAKIIIESNDPDENPYFFYVKGGSKPIRNITSGQQYYSFQNAIDEANDNDTIEVADGTYYPDEIYIDKPLLLKSISGAENCTISGNNNHRCFRVNHNETEVRGFTITSGYATGNNSTGGGGGLYCTGGTVNSCVITNNETSGRGGGIMANDNVNILNCIIAGNHAYRGGGVYLYGSNNRIDRCTIVLNSAPYNDTKVGGVFDYFGSKISNSIVYHNVNGNYCYYGNSAIWNYSCTQPAKSGLNNIDELPYFCDTATMNLNLREGSPCINTGDPAIFDPDSSRCDMGAVFYGPMVSIKVYLEGPFNGNEMSDQLGITGLIPEDQPFNNMPWYYNGSEELEISSTDGIVDWVLVELREAESASGASSGTAIGRNAGLLHEDGLITAKDGVSPLHFYTSMDENLFVVVYHRNHLGVMSAGALQNLQPGLLEYDFTTGLNQVYGGGSAMIMLDASTPGMVGGDGNRDGQIGNQDKNDIWEQCAGESGYLPGDFNLDGQVTSMDKNDVWLPNCGAGSQSLNPSGYRSQIPE